MWGAIIGDIVGSPFEFDRGGKTKDFPLFSERSHFTDDTVMTVAAMDALMQCEGEEAGRLGPELVKAFIGWSRFYRHAGYGGRFQQWLTAPDPQPYHSFGNGAAMRVSPVAWWSDDLEEVLALAKISAAVTHDHPEGIKGAQATAAAILLARQGRSKAEIKRFVVKRFGYDLSRTCDEIRPHYRHVESCQETVPEAITAFLEGESFEDALRTAVSLGGDCDTLTAIAMSIAEAFYGVEPASIREEAARRLDPRLNRTVAAFAEAAKRRRGRRQ